MFESTRRSRRSPILLLTVAASVLLHLAFVFGTAQLSLVTPTRPLAHVTGTEVEIEIQEVSVVTPTVITADTGSPATPTLF